MAEVPLLGQNNNTPRNAPPPAVEARTAFLVYLTSEGITMVSPNINLPVITERQPSPEEVISMLQAALDNLKAQQVAAHVINNLNMMGQAAMQAKMQQEMLGKLNMEKR